MNSKHIKSIKFYRAIDVHSLIGYIGGYVGLLLGFSILQMPDLLLHGFDMVKRYKMGLYFKKQ